MATRGEDEVLPSRSQDGSDELTLFAPFEASKSVSTSLPYRGESSKPPQVEINDASYLGQPKVLFRKLRTSASNSRAKSPDKNNPQSSPQQLTDSEASHAWGRSNRRVRMNVVGELSGQEKEGGGGTSVRVSNRPVSKSIVLSRIGTLGKEQVCVCTEICPAVSVVSHTCTCTRVHDRETRHRQIPGSNL